MKHMKPLLTVLTVLLIQSGSASSPTESNFYYNFAAKDGGIEELHGQLLSRLKLNPIFMDLKDEESHCNVSRSPFCEELGNTYLRGFKLDEAQMEKIKDTTSPFNDSLETVLAMLKMQMSLSSGGVFLLSLSELYSYLLKDERPTFLIDFEENTSPGYTFEPLGITKMIPETHGIQLSANLEISRGVSFVIIVSIQTKDFYIPSKSLAKANRQTKKAAEIEEAIWSKIDPSKESLQTFFMFTKESEPDQGNGALAEFDPYGNYPEGNFICTMSRPGLIYLEEVKIISFYIKKLDIDRRKRVTRRIKFYHNGKLIMKKKINLNDYEWHLVQLEPPQLATKIKFPEKLAVDNIHVITAKEVFKLFKK